MGAQYEEQIAPTEVEHSKHAQSGGRITPTLVEDSMEVSLHYVIRLISMMQT